MKWINYFRSIPQGNTEYTTERLLYPMSRMTTLTDVMCLTRKGTYSLTLFTESSAKDKAFFFCDRHQNSGYLSAEDEQCGTWVALRLCPVLARGAASPVAQWWRTRLQCRRHTFDPWVQKVPWRRTWQPTPVFLPGKSHGPGRLHSVGSQGLDVT